MNKNYISNIARIRYPKRYLFLFHREYTDLENRLCSRIVDIRNVDSPNLLVLLDSEHLHYHNYSSLIDLDDIQPEQEYDLEEAVRF
jgi:hypothetical protein